MSGACKYEVKSMPLQICSGHVLSGACTEQGRSVEGAKGKIHALGRPKAAIYYKACSGT